MATPNVALEDKDYRFAIAMALMVLMGIMFIYTVYTGGTVQDGIAVISIFIGLVSIIINSYFQTKE